MKKLVFVFAIVFGAIAATNAQSDLRVMKTMPISGEGGWDYVEVGPVNDWLYVSHATQVNVINKKTGDSVTVIPNTTGVHGIAFDVTNKKGFTSNGRLNSVTVFDMNNNTVLAQIPTGQNPDAIMYEPFSKKIITCNGRSNDLSIIDPIQNKVVASVEVGGRPETTVSDGAGKLFLNLEDKNELVVVDIKALKVINRWSLAPGEGPTGLALDKTTNRLFVGCEKILLVLDATNGNIVSKIPIGKGCDGLVFNTATKDIYTANGSSGTLSVIHEFSADKFDLVQTLTTKKSARTIAFDQQSKLVYLPAAELEAPVLGQKGRPKMIPGSFEILVVGK